MIRPALFAIEDPRSEEFMEGSESRGAQGKKRMGGGEGGIKGGGDYYTGYTGEK